MRERGEGDDNRRGSAASVRAVPATMAVAARAAPAISWAVLLLGRFASATLATTYHVPGDYATIRDANEVASAGDTILVAPGVYQQPSAFLKSGIRLIADGDSSNVVLRVPTIEVHPLPLGDSRATIIKGFTIENPNPESNNSTITVNGNPLTMISRNRIIGPNCVFSWGAMTLVHNTIQVLEPWASQYALRVVGHTDWPQGELTIAYNTFLLSGWGFEIDCMESVTEGAVHHNTFVFPGWPEYTYPAYYGSVNAGTAALAFSSNILWGVRMLCGAWEDEGGSLDVAYNCYYPFSTQSPWVCPGPGEDGNIEANPLFCTFDSFGMADWRLKPTSPCIGAGEGGTNMGAMGVGCGLVPVLPPEAGGHVASPLGLALFAANPFSPPLRIRCAIPSPGASGSLEVFDASGRPVRTLAAGWLSGEPSVWLWDGRNGWGDAVASGAYFVRLRTGEASATRRVLLIR
jgi:hypothetical protein